MTSPSANAESQRGNAWRDVALVVAGVVALTWAKLPPWVVVLALAVAGWIIAIR